MNSFTDGGYGTGNLGGSSNGDGDAGTGFLDGGYIDGNALGGALREIFAFDVTAARGRCAGCGLVAEVGMARVYPHAAGSVARCSGCDSVLMRLVSAPDRVFLDMHGLSFLEIPVPAPSPV